MGKSVVSAVMRSTRPWARRLALFYAGSNLALGITYPLLMVHVPRRSFAANEQQRWRERCRREGLRLTPIRFQAEDGVELAGSMVEPGGPVREPGVVLLHGRFDTHKQALPHALYLARAGHPVLAFDRRGQGASDAHPCTYGLTERRDVTAAVRLLRARTSVRAVSLMGFSLGAAIALQAAPDLPEIKAVIADSSFAELRSVADHYGSGWGHLPGFLTWPARVMAFPVHRALQGWSVDEVSPARSAARLRVPVLLIHGGRDWQVPSEHSRRIAARLAGPHELWVIPGAGHTRAYGSNRAEYERRVLDFLRGAGG